MVWDGWFVIRLWVLSVWRTKESFFLVSMGYYELLKVTMGDRRKSEGRSSKSATDPKLEGKKMVAKV